MNSYQVDECLNSKKLVAACAAEGLVNIRRFPTRLKHREDPIVLQEILPTEWTLITTDREIHLTHSEFIPNKHSGILIIASYRSLHTLVIRDVLVILKKFEADFPDWHTVSICNSVLELSEEQTEVWQVLDGVAKRVGLFEFKNQGWQSDLRILLMQISGITDAKNIPADKKDS